MFSPPASEPREADKESFEKSAHDLRQNKACNVESGLTTAWEATRINKLINLWRDRPLLYNTSHKEYSVRAKRREAMEEISQELNTSAKEIASKMLSLRTYYGSQHRKKIACDKEGSSAFKSRWQFFADLEFLQDYMSQRPADFTMASFLEDETSMVQINEEFKGR